MASSDSWLGLRSLSAILMTRASFKVNEEHLYNLAIKARLENRECGYLSRRGGQDPSSSPNKWQLKWFVLYQNLLFYYENVNSSKPQGVYFLESCYSSRSPAKNSKDGEKLNCFSISYTRDGRNAIEFAAESESDCQVWIECIQSCSYNRLLSVKEEIEQKYLHLSQVYESEAKTKYQYLQQVEELSAEVRELRRELSRYRRQHHLLRTKSIAEEDSAEIRKIKKVQSLCRGWLYRQRWKRIVEEYIRSPHAELMRKRNNIVFNLVESERDYVHQLEILVANYVRPFRMAASSKKPTITHEDVNSIFLNTEIILFLHQIFYKGLSKKLENWPTFYTGDLFDMFISMLHIYLEYVRNHHYSLQCLVECKLSSSEFNKFLERCETKAACEGLTLDTLLVLPMNRIPYYIVTLANCLSHTPHAHVEREKLEHTKSKLEELSKIMHDEVSETEHIRANLAIERSIAEGCDVLLDVNQVLCRQGNVQRRNIAEEDSAEIRKIKKVQSLCRGWLYRQRWKRIVEEYIRSPHAELMRKRNNIVFNLVESERDYVHQLEILVANYVRPFRMAASSKKPTITHEDVNSIFLNTEIILFLHQIFYKGLSKKLENWPTFYTGDLFDMFISMLHIYLEYVRNHHYSLQCLVECKLSSSEFNKFLERCETKAACEGLTLDTLLVLPMNRIPYYIVTLANCLSHTPHAHVEREKLEHTKSKLEELSKIMHDEVSETEHIRANLAIERSIAEGCDVLLDVNQIMHDEVSETEHIRANLAIERSIAEGCDVLLDVNQVLCRQDSLILLNNDRNKPSLGQRFTPRDIRRNEVVVQCYLFSNHLVTTTRASNGKLHLVKGCGVIPLADVTLVEDIAADPQHLLAAVSEEDSVDDTNSNITDSKTGEYDINFNRLFRLIVESRDQTSYSATFVANDDKHKSEWCTDIAQCLQNLRYTELVTGSFRNASSVMSPESVKSDLKLYKDDSEIKYSKTLDSCKIPQIRHATVERLLERLTDLRFLSIDFLNTFLLTYRLYTDAYTVMDTLVRVYKSSPHTSLDHTNDLDGTTHKTDEVQK
ncbi:unnamed protein product [Adineta steineri]|uniref:Uncharacterized protein n=1 Tax=Adineta steineri TaxID=433720 RepID=A0A814VCC4_9BILA|nr:unnamed protein product [Adineta steineri]